MDQAAIGRVLRKHIEKTYKTHKEAAAHWKVSPPFLSAVLSGGKRPNREMLADIGYVCAEYSPNYVKVKK